MLITRTAAASVSSYVGDRTGSSSTSGARAGSGRRAPGIVRERLGAHGAHQPRQALRREPSSNPSPYGSSKAHPRYSLFTNPPGHVAIGEGHPSYTWAPLSALLAVMSPAQPPVTQPRRRSRYVVLPVDQSVSSAKTSSLPTDRSRIGETDHRLKCCSKAGYPITELQYGPTCRERRADPH